MMLKGYVKNRLNTANSWAPGFDDIPAELIKNTGHNGVKYFICLFNKIWKT